jgi:carbon-monoxide dehydrogenase large subunit
MQQRPQEKFGRVEDGRLIQGRGRFTDDNRRPNQFFAAFLRSPLAHARITAIDGEAARAAPGVLDILTARDLTSLGVGNISLPRPMVGRGGAKLVIPYWPALAAERVMMVGQPVALVVADTRDRALDAAELVEVEYEELPAVTHAEAALEPGAPQLWLEAPGNVALDWPGPIPSEENDAEVAEILARAPHCVRVRAVNQRIYGVPLEPRAVMAEFDQASGRYTLHCGSQGVVPLRDQLASALGIEARALRVITEDVGGAFGLKTTLYPEYPVLLAAARKLGRPVHWTATRSEAFLGDVHGRDHVSEAELALDDNGTFLALRVRSVSNMGAFLSLNGPFIATANFARCFPTVYRIPKIAISQHCVFTNTMPTGPYRGAGRPEANYLMERLVEAAARQTGIDAVELRRRNLVPPEAMPYATPVGTTIDSGEFAAILEQALVLAQHDSFEERRGTAAKAGKLRGIGISCFLEHAGGVGIESADISFPEAEKVALSLGVQSTGQAHATVFRDLLADQLEIQPKAIAVQQGDSDLELKGAPSVASRSAMTVSAAMAKAADELLAKGKRLAAQVLEADAGDIVYQGGAFEVAGTDRRIPLFVLAASAAAMKARGEIEDSLDTRVTADTPQSFPNGCHIAEVEIDPETGHLDLVNYVAVDDCGTVLNHTIVEGQVIGSLAQGLGQALMEQIVYDEESGQLLTGTFNDYAMPLAEQMPPVIAEEHPVPCRTNPLGVKGVGEAGTTAAIAAIMNAIADAIPEGHGVALDMPATPEKIWKACRGGI